MVESDHNPGRFIHVDQGNLCEIFTLYQSVNAHDLSMAFRLNVSSSSGVRLKMESQVSTFATKKGLAQMLKGGVIMDVVTPDQAKIAEDAGAVAVMALERVPADIRDQGGVARMSDPELIIQIMESVSIPVMAKARIGHFVEAQILEALEVDYIDESEVLTPADEEHHIDKHQFKTPFVCGCRNLGEVRHARSVMGDIRRLQNMPDEELMSFAKEISAPYDLVVETRKLGRLPVVNFAAGGIATPADAAMMMQLGVDGVFVGSGIFKSGDPAKRGDAIVKAVTHYEDPEILAEVSRNLGEAMVGRNISTMPEEEKIADRGW
jgi:pyridoxal 5'-phosphate synthase pdxS subunit